MQAASNSLRFDAYHPMQVVNRACMYATLDACLNLAEGFVRACTPPYFKVPITPLSNCPGALVAISDCKASDCMSGKQHMHAHLLQPCQCNISVQTMSSLVPPVPFEE